MKVIALSLAAVAAFLSSCSDGTGADHAAPNTADPAAVTNAAADTPTQVVERLFQAADLNRSGMLTRPEAVAYMDSVLISKDTNDDGRLSLQEFQDWDAGFLAIAEQGGRTARYNAGKEAVFKRWDANGDGSLTLEEFYTGIGKEFAAVATRQEGRMTRNEFADVLFMKDFAAAAAA